MTAPRIRVVDDDNIQCGPLRFTREDSGGSEAWEVATPKVDGLPCFRVKNYGGKPNDANPFSGWRIVGGGPFTEAGGWTTRNAAIRNATPWLLRYYHNNATEQKAKLEATLAALDQWLAGIK